MLNDTAEEKEAGNDGDKAAGRRGNRSVSHGDDVVASHARSVERYFSNAQSLLDSPVYERRVISLRYMHEIRNCYEPRRDYRRILYGRNCIRFFFFLKGENTD